MGISRTTRAVKQMEFRNICGASSFLMFQPKGRCVRIIFSSRTVGKEVEQ